MRIHGLMWNDEWINRDMQDDFVKTKEYFTKNPPSIGDPVIVLCTSAYSRMWTPEVTVISDITERKRLIVNHANGWAGKSFYRTGQNCYAPKGQCWLIPKSFYSDEEWVCYWKHIKKEVDSTIKMYEGHINRSKKATEFRKDVSSGKKILSLASSGTLSLGSKPEPKALKSEIKIEPRRNRND